MFSCYCTFENLWSPQLLQYSDVYLFVVVFFYVNQGHCWTKNPGPHKLYTLKHIWNSLTCVSYVMCVFCHITALMGPCGPQKNHNMNVCLCLRSIKRTLMLFMEMVCLINSLLMGTLVWTKILVPIRKMHWNMCRQLYLGIFYLNLFVYVICHVTVIDNVVPLSAAIPMCVNSCNDLCIGSKEIV